MDGWPIIPVAERPDDVDLRREEGKRGAHTIRKHVGKTDSELMAGMGPPAKRWQPVKLGVYRNGSFFSLEDANAYVNETLRVHEDTVAKVANGTLKNAFLKLRVGRRIGREAFRPDSYSEPIVRYAYEVGVYIEHDPSDPKGFVVITAYPRNEEPMTLKSAKPPQAFVDFAQRMFQDAEFFETLEDLLRFGLQGIPRDRLGDFTAFVKRIENHEIGDRDLKSPVARFGRRCRLSGSGIAHLPASGARTCRTGRSGRVTLQEETEMVLHADIEGPAVATAWGMRFLAAKTRFNIAVALLVVTAYPRNEDWEERSPPLPSSAEPGTWRYGRDRAASSIEPPPR